MHIAFSWGRALDISQLLGYLKATNLQIGLLVNFGQASLVTRRFINAHYDPAISPNLGK